MPLQPSHYHEQMIGEMNLLIKMKDVSCSEREYIRYLERMMKNEERGGVQVQLPDSLMWRIKAVWHLAKERISARLDHSSLCFRLLKKLYLFAKFVLKKGWHAVKRIRMWLKRTPAGGSDQPLKITRDTMRKGVAQKTLSFAVCEQPIASILIAVHNKYEYTFHCLESIQRVCKGMDYEIILVDDLSSDETVTIEERIRGITVIHNSVNLGFLKNCNMAARKARGKYLVFLNNDTLVHENWLSALISPMEGEDTIGMTGSKFLYPDGTIQEAGGIIWRDATGCNYGRGKPGNAYDCNYVKDVDYISGASICVRRALWEQIGGFDERYAPAYFEDSDLAFSVRKLGYRVVYQPHSVVTHFERVSYSGAKSNSFMLMNRNRSAFIEKWEQELKAQYEPGFENEYQARERIGKRKRLLMLDDMIPQWDKNAGAKTTRCYLELFKELGYQILFVGVNDFVDSEPYSRILEKMGIEVFYGHYNREMFLQWLDRYAHYFDVIFINRPHVANQYLDEIRKRCSARIAYYGHDLHYLRMQREYELTKDIAMLKQSRYSYANEMNIMRKADIVLSVSPEECDRINAALGEDKARHTPIGFYSDQLPERPDFEETSGLLFVGGFNHTPNIDAVLWFMQEIWPDICAAIPDISLTIAGSNPGPEILKFAGKQVSVPGYLSDEELSSLYLRSKVFIAPLRFGAGVKGKITDALFAGIPIVSTAVGLEGLEGIDQILGPTTTKKEWIEHIIKAYTDEEHAKTLCLQEQDYMKRHFGRAKALATFRQIFGDGIVKE